MYMLLLQESSSSLDRFWQIACLITFIGAVIIVVKSMKKHD